MAVEGASPTVVGWTRQNGPCDDGGEVAAVGNAKRIKLQRRTLSQRRTVVVDSCEVGQHEGMLTLRVSDRGAPPVCLAIPAEAAAGMVAHLRTASIDAEELYWECVQVAMRGVTPGDAAAAVNAMRSFLLKQDWAEVIRRVPAGADEMFLISHAGHVGLAIAPPFTDRRSLIIFDPMQLRRLAPSFQSALAAAHTNIAPVITPETVAQVLSLLAARPWPGGDHQEPTLEQARAEMQRGYRQFLTREPYLRPAEHNVPDA